MSGVLWKRFSSLAVAGLLLALAPAASRADDAAAAKMYGAAAPDYGHAQVATINKMIRKTWADYELKPSTRAPDGEWARRLFLDVLGRVPSYEELNAFLTDGSEDKRAKLVHRLLYDDSYTEEYARNMTTVWTNVLIGRNGGNEQNSLTNREGMQKYLRDTFARNKPYDTMAYELVTATGHNTPGATNFNGAVNFLTSKLNEMETPATAQTARIFMGLQVQCTQCHNHPFNDWKQEKFWQMNAFFKQTAALRRFAPGTRNVTGVELVNQDYAGESKNPSEADLFYELRSGLLKVAYPVFVDGTDISKSGFVSDVVRRTELGKMITKSKYLELSLVNRTWQHFMGYGFTKPIDDMGPHNPATHPELLEYLAAQVREGNFNVKELIRWIVLSEPYALSSISTATAAKDDPALGETPKFARFYLRQMRAEELYESLIVVTQAEKTRGDYEAQEKTKSEWLKQFIVAFGTDEGDESTTFNGTIPQALMLFNGDLIKKAISTEKGSFLEQVANNSKLNAAAKINYLFMAALCRKPTPGELTRANQLLQSHNGNVTAALQDMFWAILNSNEFIINH